MLVGRLCTQKQPGGSSLYTSTDNTQVEIICQISTDDVCLKLNVCCIIGRKGKARTGQHTDLTYD